MNCSILPLKDNIKKGAKEKRPCFHRFCVSVLLLPLLLCPEAHAADFIIFNKRVRNHYADEAFVEKCKKIARLNWVGGNPRPMRVFQEQYDHNADMCHFFDVLAKSKQPERSFFDHKQLGKQMYKWVNLYRLGSSIDMRLEFQKYQEANFVGFADVVKGAPRYSPYGFAVEEFFEDEIDERENSRPDWQYNMKAIAAGDFDGDGLEDILVEFIDDCLGMCTYFSVNQYIFSRKGPFEEIEIQHIISYDYAGAW